MAIEGIFLKKGLIETYTTELSDKLKATQLSVKDEGLHRRCWTITLGLLALISLAAGGWLYWTQGQAALTATGILGGLSCSLVLAIILISTRSIKREKAQEAAYSEAAQEQIELPFDEAVKVLGKISIQPIKSMVKELDEDRREALFNQFLDEITPPKNFSGSSNVLYAFINDSDFIEKLEARGEQRRAIALEVVRRLNPSGPYKSLATQLVTIAGAPQSENEVELYARDLAWLKDFLEALPKKRRLEYQRAFVAHATPDRKGLFPLLFFKPTSLEEVNSLMRHKNAGEELLADPNKGRLFALELLNFLPIDSERSFLKSLFDKVGAPQSQAGATILFRLSPLVITHAKKNIEFAAACLQYAHELGRQDIIDELKTIETPYAAEDLEKFAKNPRGTALMAQQKFAPQTIASIVTQMTDEEKIDFFKELAKFINEGTDEVAVKAAAREVIKTLLNESFMSRFDHTPTAVDSWYKLLLKEMGLFPKELASHLFVHGFGSESSLLGKTFFLSLLFQGLDERTQGEMYHFAASRLQDLPTTVDVFNGWLDEVALPHVWSYKAGLMAASPVALGKVAARFAESPASLEQVLTLMSVTERNRYEESYRTHFALFFEEQLYSFKKSDALNTKLENVLLFMGENPQRILDHELLAKKYAELLVLSESSPRLRSVLIVSRPELFSLVTVEAGSQSVKIPMCRLRMLSHFFDALFAGGMREVRDNKISLEGVNGSDFLAYLAQETVTIDQNNVMGLLHLAKQYGIVDLIQKCLDYLNSHEVANFDDLLDFADKEELFDLRYHCLNFLISDGGAAVRTRYQRLPLTERFRQIAQLAVDCKTAEVQIQHTPSKKVVSWNRQRERQFIFEEGFCTVIATLPLMARLRGFLSIREANIAPEPPQDPDSESDILIFPDDLV